MENNYPCFDPQGIREEYSEKINSIFQKENLNNKGSLEKNIDWIAYPAKYSSYVFIGQKGNIITPLSNSDSYVFPNVARIGVNTKEGILRLGMIVYPSINDSNSKKILEDKGYIQEYIDGQPKLYFLAKNLKNLESLVKELREIFPVLLQK